MTETVTYPLTNRTYIALAIGRGIAAANGHSDITPAHVALGILKEGANMAAGAIQRAGVHPVHLRHQLESELPPDGHPQFGEVVLPSTPGEQAMLEAAAAEVGKLGDPYLGNEHLLLAMLHNPETSIAQLFARNGITYESALTHLRVLRSGGI